MDRTVRRRTTFFTLLTRYWLPRASAWLPLRVSSSPSCHVTLPVGTNVAIVVLTVRLKCPVRSWTWKRFAANVIKLLQLPLFKIITNNRFDFLRWISSGSIATKRVSSGSRSCCPNWKLNWSKMEEISFSICICTSRAHSINPIWRPSDCKWPLTSFTTRLKWLTFVHDFLHIDRNLSD